jgi:hypothetical protein
MMIKDETWADQGLNPRLKIALCTFGILALELALIRWTSTQMRAFAYFNNVVLISAFLGMGIGLALGRRWPGLLHWALPTLLLVSIPMAFAESLGLVHLQFPDPVQSIYLWDSIEYDDSLGVFLRSLSIFLAVFSLIVVLFALLGAPVGYLFQRTDNLRAYSYDLLGSLLGVVVFTLITFINAGPAAWLLLGGLPFALLSRRAGSLVCLVLVGALGFYSVQGALFSPYNRIDLIEKSDRVEMQVNRDFHQFMHDFSLENIRSSKNSAELWDLRRAYDLAFSVGQDRDSALIVGAGTGNDVQAAIRHGYSQIVSCDIDPMIIQVGFRHHPEKPYLNPSVIPVANDARAFFEQYEGDPFDVICYGILDSHAMLSSMSSLRLDNYVYTKEGLEQAWEHVGDRGYLSLSFWAFGSEWLADRIYWTLKEATGEEPVCFMNGVYAMTYVVSKDWTNVNLAAGDGLKRHIPTSTAEDIRISTDDWPFLYLNPHVVPWPYVLILSIILIGTVISVRWAYGGKAMHNEFNGAMFCMGVAFLLLQTRGVTSMALLLGSTWIVNAAMFTGVLLMLWLAAVAVDKLNLQRVLPWFGALFASLLLLRFFDFSILNNLPVVYRGFFGGLVNGLPIGFAGVIFPLIFRKCRNSSAALGSNLIGAVFGGCLEYFSMLLGLSNLVVIAFVFYAAAGFFTARQLR